MALFQEIWGHDHKVTNTASALITIAGKQGHQILIETVAGNPGTLDGIISIIENTFTATPDFMINMPKQTTTLFNLFYPSADTNESVFVKITGTTSITSFASWRYVQRGRP